MKYSCDICRKDVKKKSKHSHLKSKSHIAFEKFKHIIFSLKNIELRDVDKILSSSFIHE